MAVEIAASDGDAQPVGALVQKRRDWFGSAIGANGIIGVVALHGVVGECDIAAAARQRADMIEAGRERESAGATEPSIGRLKAEQAAERRGHPDRAVGVGAER